MRSARFRFPPLKMKAMNRNDNPMPPHPYISSAQAKEPELTD
jgi:hypothetical protein